jgi:E3 ubiquitin-protein ligase SHPRH
MEDIRTINGKYTESSRHRQSYFWDSQQLRSSFDNFRPAINLNTLIALLKVPEEDKANEGEQENIEGDYDSDDEGERHVGNKRQHCTSTSPMRSKRRRLVEDDGELDVDNRSELSLDDDYECEDDCQDPAYKQIYPCIWEGRHKYVEPKLDPASQYFPVFKSSLEMRYTKSARVDHNDSFVTDKAAKKLGWLKEEEDLLSLFSALCPDRSQPRTFDLGRFWVQDYRARLLALSGEPECPRSSYPEEIKEKSERWFFLLPQIAWPDCLSKEELEDNGMQHPSMHEDLLQALFAFQSLGRAKVETTVQVIALPEGGYDPAEELPFRLHAQLNVSVVAPSLYQPFDARNISQKQVSELEGLQRRLIALFIPTLHQPLFTVEHDHGGEASIPFFYGTLRPAPALPQGVTYESLQPEDLVPSLLPFQRRSVEWMLQRERKMMSQEGDVVPYIPSQSHPVMPPFWEKISLGGREHFFNTVTGSVSPSCPEDNTALGGILAEEPGISVCYWS